MPTGPWGRAAAAAMAAVLVLAVPATALAAGTTTTIGNQGTNLTIIPYEDCITVNANGSTLAWFGYYSFAGGNTTINKGTSHPSHLDGESRRSSSPATSPVPSG